MNEEAVAMFEHENAGIAHILEGRSQGHVKKLWERRRLNTTAKYQLHDVNVSVENIEALRQVYTSEIYLFGYPDTPFVGFTKSWWFF